MLSSWSNNYMPITIISCTVDQVSNKLSGEKKGNHQGFSSLTFSTDFLRIAVPV